MTDTKPITDTSGQDLRYLAVSGNVSADVVAYPDSNKVLAYSDAYEEKLWNRTRRADATDYFDGE